MAAHITHTYPPLKLPFRIDSGLLFRDTTERVISDFAISCTRLAVVARFGRPKTTTIPITSLQNIMPKLKHLSPGISQYETPHKL